MTNQAAGENPLKVFGAMLAYYRNRVGMTPEQLGARVYLSGSQIRKVEAGQGSKARRLRWFEPLVVPGLLQTEAYARAILSTRMGATREELDDAVAGRVERQRILDREHPPELWVILDEAVLRRPVGSPDVMRDQLVRLVEAGQRPNIAIQMIPFGAGAHEGLRGGAFIVADFDGAATIAYQDAASSGQILEDAAEVDALALTWDTLRLDALPRTASISLITSVAEAV